MDVTGLDIFIAGGAVGGAFFGWVGFKLGEKIQATHGTATAAVTAATAAATTATAAHAVSTGALADLQARITGIETDVRSALTNLLAPTPAAPPPPPVVAAATK